MNVIDVRAKIGVVHDRMLPESPLPQTTTRVIAVRQIRTAEQDALSEERLDSPPAMRKIIVAIWKGKNRVQMLRQNDDGVDVKWALRSRLAKSETQNVQMVDQPR